jgi:pimeloyl-ACP methyl ester carboxylesterase
MRRVATYLLLLTSFVAAVAVATTSALAQERLLWTPCPEVPEDTSVQCATLRVSLDWSRPDGETIELALARRLATEPSARIGTLMFDLGGPGSSGVDAVLNGGPGFSDEIRRRFDIVGFDPRGIGRSHPVLCPIDLLESIPFYYPTSQADIDAYRAFNNALRTDCAAHTGPLLTHVDTKSVARDLDAVRAALGERQLTFYGISYGTVLAEAYAELFPHRVRAMVLDSVLDHSMSGRELLEAGAIALEDSYDQFADWCDAEPTCALYGRVREVTAELYARVDRGEIPFDATRAATRFDLSEVFQLTLRIQIPAHEFWAVLAESILNFYNATTPTSGATTTQRGGDEITSPALPFTGSPVRCQDFDLSIEEYADVVRHLRRSERLAPDMRFAPDRLSQAMACVGTPTPIANPQHRLQVRTDVPLLLVNNRHDPVTGYTMATSVARQLGPRGRLLTSEDWGHGVYGESECVTSTIDGYLTALELPPPGMSCPGVPTAPAGISAVGTAPRLVPALESTGPTLLQPPT